MVRFVLDVNVLENIRFVRLKLAEVWELLPGTIALVVVDLDARLVKGDLAVFVFGKGLGHLDIIIRHIITSDLPSRVKTYLALALYFRLKLDGLGHVGEQRAKEQRLVHAKSLV